MSVAREDSNQLNDTRRDAVRLGAGSYEYTDRNGKVITGTTGRKGGVLRRSFDSDTADYAKMSRSQLEAEANRLKSISDTAYQTSTRVAASRTGSQVKVFADADSRIAKIKRILKRK